MLLVSSPMHEIVASRSTWSAAQAGLGVGGRDRLWGPQEGKRGRAGGNEGGETGKKEERKEKKKRK